MLSAPMQDPTTFRWTYVGLAIGGFVLVLIVLAFAYLLARRHWEWTRRVVNHPLLGQMDRMLSKSVPGLWGFVRRRFTISEWRGLSLTLGALIVFAAFYIFALITESWADEEALYAFDQRIYRGLLEAMNPEIAAFMRAVTHLGDGVTITIISVMIGIWLLVHADRWAAVSLLLSVGVGAGLMHGLKWIFARSRPGEQLTGAIGHSFPSGHTFMAATLYGFLIYLVWRRVESDAVRIGATIGISMIIVMVGLSRVLLRVHWASDVAGGLAVGFGWLVCSLIITRALQSYYTK